MKHHHDLSDDGDEIPVESAASESPPAPASPPSGERASEAASPPREEPGELGAAWRWLGDLHWLDGKPPSRRWLLQRDAEPQEDTRVPRGFLPLGKVGMIAAAGGAGKTMALVQLAVSVATGRPWLGHYTVPPESRGRVLLALGEEDAEEVQRRLYAIRTGLELNPQEVADLKRNLMVLPLAGKPVQLIAAAGKDGKPEETPFLGELRRRLSTAGVDWKLLVLDPLSRWAGPETETDNFAATRFVSIIESLAQVPGGPTVLLAHHTTKAARKEGSGDATAARGASALTDGVRWVATMSKADTGGMVLSLAKTNYTAPAADLMLKQIEGGVLRALTPNELDAKKVAEGTKAKRKASEKNGQASKPEETDDDPNQPAF